MVWREEWWWLFGSSCFAVSYWRRYGIFARGVWDWIMSEVVSKGQRRVFPGSKAEQLNE